MRILLDTCEFLWFISGDAALAARTKQEVENPANEVFLSVVSFWEILIKHALGKLPLPQPPEIYIPAQRDLHGTTATFPGTAFKDTSAHAQEKAFY